MLEHNHLNTDHDCYEEHKDKHEVDNLDGTGPAVHDVHGEETGSGADAAIEAETGNAETTQATLLPITFAAEVLLLMAWMVISVNLH